MHELKLKNRSERTQNAVDTVKDLHKLFNGEKTRFSKESLRIMAACNLFGYGCSDEGTIMIMAGTIKALLNEMGIKDISAEAIAKGLPSRATLVQAEKELAADCLVKVCYEIIKDGAKNICIITDHGHRKGQDHFVKLICWAGKDDNGEWTIKYHCLDVDIGGHSAENAANAVKLSTEEIMSILKDKLGDDVEISKVTGDSGGGAAVHRLWPELVKNGTMSEDTLWIACIMHGLNKSLEIACVDALGKQGVGHRTPWQMLWLFCSILKKIKKDEGTDMLNQMWAMVVDKLIHDEKWQTDASAKCKQPFEDLVARLLELEMDDLDALIKVTTEAPTNIRSLC